MNNRDGGGPAYPVNTTNDGTPGSAYCSAGMTMRQYYKAAALPAVIHLLKDEATDPGYGECVADLCKVIADALLAEDEVHEREVQGK